MHDLSVDQKSVLRQTLRWHGEEKKQVLTIGGYAGTGKTTLVGILRNELEHRRRGLRVALASYTGKASRVLQSKIREAYARFPHDYLGTIHGLIYSRNLQEDGKIIGWKLRSSVDYDLIIIDEASMVDEDIWRDLLSYGKRVIAVGDHGQLPPVQGKFNLMRSPDLELRRIHRQAAKNPILRLSEEIRRKGTFPRDLKVPEIRFLERAEAETEDFLTRLFEDLSRDTLVLCAGNRTRVELNKRIRAARGFTGDVPLSGERVICLKNNWNAAPRPVCNGMLGTVVRLDPSSGEDPPVWPAKILMDDEEDPYEGRVSPAGFHQKSPQELFGLGRRSKNGTVDFFDFGYALTVHKAQGSEAARVVVFVEKFWIGDVWKRWLYTAVTRAREELIVVR